MRLSAKPGVLARPPARPFIASLALLFAAATIAAAQQADAPVKDVAVEDAAINAAPINAAPVNGVPINAGPASAAAVKVESYPGAIKVACLGDSITAGYHAGGKNAARPAKLATMLGEKWSVRNFGVSGTTLMKTGESYQDTDDFRGALELQPDVIVIMLGTNDTKPRLWARKAQFESDYNDLIQKLGELPSKPILLLCHPPFVGGKNQYGIREEPILEQIPLIDKIAAERKLAVIDIHGALADKGNMLPDNVHPNNEGAMVIAQTVYRALTGQDPPAAAAADSEPAKKSRKARKKEKAGQDA